MARTLTRQLEVMLPERRLAYQLHWVPRRRHVHLLVDDQGMLHVRAPYRYPARDAEHLIQDNQGWVLRQMHAATQRVRNKPPLESGARLPLLDTTLSLTVNPVQQVDLFSHGTEVGPGEVMRQGDELLVRLDGGGDDELRKLLEYWYRRQAEHLLKSRLRPLSALLGVVPNRVSIRAQKTCWGSCSARRNISLNWRLVLLPEVLARYVIVHELCHLRHLDHSRRFWALVATVVPDYRRRRRELHAAQSTLPL